MSRKSKNQTIEGVVDNLSKLDIDEKAKAFIKIKETLVADIVSKKEEKMSEVNKLIELKDSLGE